MAHHDPVNLSPADSRRLDGLTWPLFLGCLIVGVAGLVLSLGVSLLFVERGLQRWGFAYLFAFGFVLSLGLGSLFFVVVTHLFRAGWCVLFRRVPEVIAGSVPALAVLFLPILIYVVSWNGLIYPWAQHLPDAHAEHHEAEGGHGPADAAHEPHSLAPHGHEEVFAAAAPSAPASETVHVDDVDDAEAADAPMHVGQHADEVETSVAHGWETQYDEVTLAHAVHEKDLYLNLPFFLVRCVLYFALWSAIGVWYWRTSTRQDLTGDAGLTRRMEIVSAPAMFLFGTTLTFAAFDFFMSLDPTWFSTMFGVYYFAGTFQATMAMLILLVMALQARGFLPSVTKEHYHDMGKLLFAFVVFWAYIAFSQYMLIWYAAIPVEQPWMIARGMSTNNEHSTPWGWVALILLFGRFIIPFLGLMSRHVKRYKASLGFWAGWIIVMHVIDMFWVVLPSWDPTAIPVPIVEILALLGVLGIFAAVVVRLASKHSLVAIGDPRVPEALAFRNI